MRAICCIFKTTIAGLFMNHLLIIFLILMPMFIGFCFSVPTHWLTPINRVLNILIYMILLIIGMELTEEKNLWMQLSHIAIYSIFLFILLMICNLCFLILLDKYRPWKLNLPPQTNHHISFTGGLIQIGVLVIGIGIGLLFPNIMIHQYNIERYALMSMIFLVGIQLRGGGISLRKVLLNKQGIFITAVFILSCTSAGIIFSLCIPTVSIPQGLALSSGYGWYSLSGIMMKQAYNTTWGSVVLLNDLLRELFALAFIPLIMRRSPSAAIGIGGSAALDFMLPPLQHSGGIATVPVAICFGFMANIFAPLFMAIYSSI